MRLTIFSAVASVLLAAALLAVFLLEDSVLAAAQAADSAADVLVAIGLVFAVVIARRPADGSHHFGHGQAEPVAALVAAFVAAQLGLEVLQAAVTALRGDALEGLSAWAAIVFATKVAVKAGVALFAFRYRRTSAALDALAIDARNDVLVGCVAIVGFFAINSGFGRVDAVLALGVGLFVVVSAIALAARSIHLLMGAAPENDQLEQLRAMANGVEGVAMVEELRARVTGSGIAVSVVVQVESELSVSHAHSIADSVESALVADEDVFSAEVHVHPDDGVD